MEYIYWWIAEYILGNERNEMGGKVMIESTRQMAKGCSEGETFETDFESVAVIGNMKVQAGVIKLLSKWSDSKYFQFCRVQGLSLKYSSIVTQKQSQTMYK